MGRGAVHCVFNRHLHSSFYNKGGLPGLDEIEEFSEIAVGAFPRVGRILVYGEIVRGAAVAADLGGDALHDLRIGARDQVRGGVGVGVHVHESGGKRLAATVDHRAAGAFERPRRGDLGDPVLPHRDIRHERRFSGPVIEFHIGEEQVFHHRPFPVAEVYPGI